MSSVEESPVLGSVSDLNDLCACEQLHDQTGSDDGRDAELHQGAAIGGQDDADPVERIGRVRAHDSEQGNLKIEIYIFKFSLNIFERYWYLLLIMVV